MEPMRIAQVLEYMRCDDDDDRAIQCIGAAEGYLKKSGIPDDDSEDYMMSVKTLALSLYDGTPLQKEGGKLINQQELANMDLDW